MTVEPRLCQTTPAVTRVHIKCAGALPDAYVRAVGMFCADSPCSLWLLLFQQFSSCMTFRLFPGCCQEESASSVFWYFCLVFRLLLVFAACSCYDLICTDEVSDLNFLPALSPNPPAASHPAPTGLIPARILQ